mmetsp:Transcript_44498/g.103963  ORF Transcript_44498/g.103963 Transcript_44498/m.103963 type:complete len:458 (-) Transcript_44498:2-1375(-)
MDDLLHSLRGRLALLAVADRNLELLQELQQRAVVHPSGTLVRDGVHHVGHVRHVKVHDTAPSSHRSELLSLLVDFDLPLVGLLQLAFDLLGLGFGVGKHLDELRILQQVPLRVGETLQELLIQKLQGLRVVGDVLFESRQCVFQALHLHADELTQQLLLQALQRHREVDDRRFRRELRGEVGIRQSRCEVECEVFLVVHVLITDVDVEILALLDNLLVQDRVEHRVDFILNVLDDEAEPFTHGKLDLILQVLGCQCRNAHRRVLTDAGFLSGLDPAIGLSLRVDHQSIARGSGDHDGVLDGKLITRQTLKRPLADGSLVHKERDDFHLLMRGNLPLLRVLLELAVQLVTELRVERPAIDDEGANAAHVTNQPLAPQREIFGVFGPSRILAGESGQQLVRSIHLPLHCCSTLLKLIHDALRLSQLRIQLCDLREHLVQLRFGSAQLAHGLRQPGLSDL